MARLTTNQGPQDASVLHFRRPQPVISNSRQGARSRCASGFAKDEQVDAAAEGDRSDQG
jgi:hypothetical protein